MPELATECPNDEWICTTLGEALVFRPTTGSKKDAQRATAALSILHEMHSTQVRAGRPSHPIFLGGQMVRIDYAPHKLFLSEI